MKKQYVIVELRRPAQLRKAAERIMTLEVELARLREQLRELEGKYTWECYLNMELCDLCRERGVSFRPALESARKRT